MGESREVIEDPRRKPIFGLKWRRFHSRTRSSNICRFLNGWYDLAFPSPSRFEC